MRAIETGRPMLRATNTGVTAIIDPKGRIAASAPEFTTTTVTGEVHGYQGITPVRAFRQLGVPGTSRTDDHVAAGGTALFAARSLIHIIRGVAPSETAVVWKSGANHAAAKFF